jgi:hypothetical protein
MAKNEITEDEIWEDEIGSVYCYGIGGFVWIKQEDLQKYRKQGKAQRHIKKVIK